MSNLQATLLRFAHAAHRYLRISRLTPSLQLFMPLAPMLGALVLASGGKPSVGAAIGVLMTVLSLWGVAWGFNDLSDALRADQGNSLILRGVVTIRQAVWWLVALTLLALLVSSLLGWRFSALAAVTLLVSVTFPWLRRRTYLIDAWFGLGIALSIPLAYAAIDRWPDKVGGLLGVVTLLWAMGWLVLQQWPHHLELLARGARSLGLMFDTATGYLVIALQISVLLGAWMAGVQAKFGAPFLWLLLASGCLVIWQGLLIHQKGTRAVSTALNLHLLSGVAIWLGVVLHFASN